MILINKIKEVGHRYWLEKRKEIYLKARRKRVKNLYPTIISRNCCGGIIYHDMGLKFMSPTIDLFFSPDDFIKFVENLQEYLDCELIEKVNSNCEYPVGILKKEITNKDDIDDKEACNDITIGEDVFVDGGGVEINFKHYKTFDIAKKKWDERKSRVDFNNIFIIMDCKDATEKQVDDFLRLPYKYKVMFTNDTYTHKGNSIISMPCYKKHKFNILDYDNTGIKRWLDYYDYIAFLNKE